jgi:hypothetical protein
LKTAPLINEMRISPKRPGSQSKNAKKGDEEDND